jgi:predicted nuclease of predicted toxin-antitoxin system
MKFLIDAQLPPSLKQLFLAKGYDCIHTFDLELGNNTPDKIINKISIEDKRILITKDSDFFQSFIIKNEPYNFFSDKFSEIISTMQKEDIMLISQD